ncbi:breast carcinoma-amplified sequence 1 isoform X2 [Leuresthes tenuis]|uniref:breast carcinoma-amplified sequence 1 isoform X2 n=1 Tax=Leuresthes tenuis TaxID=355514 RepID=UPI003B51074C
MGNEQSTNEELTQNGNISKHGNGSVNGFSTNITSNSLEIDMKTDNPVHQNGEPIPLNLATESSDCVVVESDTQSVSVQVISEIPDTNNKTEEVKTSKEEKDNRFSKLFKKKDHKPDGERVQEKEKKTSNEDQVDKSNFSTDPQQETANLKQDSEPVTEPESVTLDSSPDCNKVSATDNGNGQPVESQEDGIPEENPVMNFFKTLVTTTKTSKKETAAPEATKDQSLKDTQPTAPTTVAQISEPPAAPKGMPAPPPPPPEPPKMEIKGEPTAKPVKPASKEDTKAAAKEPETSKGKSAKDTLSRFFRPKETPVEVQQPVVEVQTDNKVEHLKTAVEVPQRVVQVNEQEDAPQPGVEAEKVDPSKTGTLEAAAKPEPPPAVQEEKRAASKSSFLSLFKPKAAEPKKTTPTPPAAAEAAQAVKAKEDPKAAAKSSEAVVDNKPVPAASQAGDDAANVPRKLEKRNSIQLFFKNLGQKRHSTDAGVQTEPATVAPAAEKAK